MELAGRLKFPAFTKDDGSRKFEDYKDFIVNFEKEPGIGFLSGYRGKDGKTHLRGEPNPKQWEAYIENQGFFVHHLAPNQQFYRFANKEYLELAKHAGWVGKTDPITIELYSETQQRFKLAGQGLYDGPQPTKQEHKDRLTQFFDPLPIWHKPLEQTRIDEDEYPFYAVNQRPMFMYHSWDSQNAWLRQICAQNYLYMNRGKAESMGIEDLSWVWMESHNGRVRVQVKLIEGCEPSTVWTWNAIGKQKGAWGLKPEANESNKGFLMNHLISELLPKKGDPVDNITNSDPVTGQAAWYDLKVKITPADPEETSTWPDFETVKPAPGMSEAPDQLRYAAHKPVHLNRSIRDVLTRGSLDEDR